MTCPVDATGALDLPGSCDYFVEGGSFFVDPEHMTNMQLLWAFASYGYVLYASANMIGDGAELLLFIPQYAGIVGSIFLPILGAVPDGMMVLFSGVGAIKHAQFEVAVGVGALAGSTIMLLTLPWTIAIFAGRVDMDADGTMVGYSKKAGARYNPTSVSQALFHTGIKFQDGVRNNAKLMALTSLSYLAIQIPAFGVDDNAVYDTEDGVDAKEVAKEAGAEQVGAVIGLVMCIVFFILYLVLQYISGAEEEAETSEGSAETTTTGAKVEVGHPYVAAGAESPTDEGFSPSTPYLKRMTTNLGLKLGSHRSAVYQAANEDMGLGLLIMDFQKEVMERRAERLKRGEQFAYGGKIGNSLEAPLIHADTKIPTNLKTKIESLFAKYAKFSQRHNHIALADMNTLVRKLGLQATEAEIHGYCQEVDANKDRELNKAEFMEFFLKMMAVERKPRVDSMESMEQSPTSVSGADSDDDPDEDEDELPEEFQNLPLDEQRRKIMMSAFQQMAMGTILVLIFSDPMVDVLSKIGQVINISPFFVSFILAPLASNASELIAAAKLASKKTSKTITYSLQTLEGAACMNNTFCLGIFYALIIKQGLAWKFTAETLVIVLVQIAMTGIVLVDYTQKTACAFFILSLYPLSLVFVAVCNGTFKID